MLGAPDTGTDSGRGLRLNGGVILDRESWLAATMIELAGTPSAGFDEAAYASAFAGRLAELFFPAEVAVLIPASPGYPVVTAGSSQRAAGLARLESHDTAGPAADCCRARCTMRQRPLTASGTPWPEFAAAARAAGFGSVAALPMNHHDETTGAVTVLAAGDHRIDAAELGLAELLTEAAAIGVLQQRVLARSLRTAQQLQQALDSRVIIEQAKGAVAAWLDITPGRAFELLRGYSRRSGRLLAEVARDVVGGVIRARDLPGPGETARRGAPGRRGAAGRRTPA